MSINKDIIIALDEGHNITPKPLPSTATGG